MDWNDEKRLLVFADVKEGQRSAQIAVTNLDGSLYQELTTGALIYAWARWGPGDEVLCRRVGGSDFGGPAEIVAVDVKTGEVRTLLRSEDLEANTFYEIDY